MSTENIPTSIYIQDFRDLILWQKAVKLSDRIYKVVNNFPDYKSI